MDSQLRPRNTGCMLARNVFLLQHASTAVVGAGEHRILRSARGQGMRLQPLRHRFTATECILPSKPQMTLRGIF
jgi:hypothetical protein